MSVLIIAEHDGQKLSSHTLQTITASQYLKVDKVDLFIIGYRCRNAANYASQINGISKVLYADNEIYKDILAENISKLIAEVGGNYDYILSPNSAYSHDFLPRASAMLNTQMITDVCKIEGPNIFTRPIYAGSAFKTLQLDEDIKIITILPSIYEEYDDISSDHMAYIETIPPYLDNKAPRLVYRKTNRHIRNNLEKANIIVAGGNGLQSKESFEALIFPLAEKLGAAVGASSGAVDAGFAPEEFLIESLPTPIYPDLYIAVGISGVSQHLAIIKDAKCIVAINSDPNSPIFDIADYAIIDDLFKVVPEITQLM